MGGANSKDPARINYKVHNIYLNFVTTYGRILPSKPITIYQKTLFVFWLSVILLWTLLLLAKAICYLYSKVRKKDDPDGLEKAKSLNKSFDEENQIITPSKQFISPSKRIACGANEHLLKAIMEKKSAKEIEEEENTNFVTSLVQLLKSSSPEQPPFEGFIRNLVLFGAIMFYIWLCDYLHMWPKVDKQYSRDAFLFLFGLLLFVSIVFTRKTTKDKLINRDQTEEWKGWMQVQFVWYHYFDAQEVFNSIRCYIAAYVWMTGFGNFIYFWNRQDYSIFRLLKMLFRLNFLVLVVMAVTNSEFVRYYICAMHTYWFLSVWAMMAFLHKYNHNRWFMALKFVLYAVANSLIFEIPGAPAKVFLPFSFILNVKGKLDYWIYRSVLDHWSTLVGMLIAYNYPYFEKLFKFLESTSDAKFIKTRQSIRIFITVVLLVILGLWFHYFLLIHRDKYLKIHPYTSPIPILVYLWLRNLHPFLRTHFLGALAWLGKITLETYLSQIHMYMMGDAKRIIVYLPNYPLLNFSISTLIYIGVSYKLFQLTVFFSSYILPKDLKVIGKNFIFGFIWFGLCFTVAYSLTYERVWSTEKSGLEFLIWNINSTIVEKPR